MTDMRDQTFGQRRVRTNFNPSARDDIKQIKNQCANLIDLIDDLCNHTDDLFDRTHGEQIRLARLAQTHIETACMFAVKAITCESQQST